MLANANVKELELEDDEDEDVQTEVDLEANRQKRIKKKSENDTLTSEQMNQVPIEAYLITRTGHQCQHVAYQCFEMLQIAQWFKVKTSCLAF